MSNKRRSIGRDPLDALFAPAEQIVEAQAAQAAQEADAQRRPQAAPRADKKTRVTFHLNEALIDEVRDAVFALSGPPLAMTLSAFAEEALRRELRRLSRAHQGGEAFPPRVRPLKTGRPTSR
ncbi:hypothetical protein KKF91_16810 [Myxococcota bacterium]|nr:hypothetical protein [Myxococcota bacterium]MBU1432199.1 hypothetical protein [Myxococcota bacterium]MBU1900191.1 hypothetical protein [Myxococcota bacterium]